MPAEKANILLVDDNPLKRIALTAVLEDLGHNIFQATSGQETLRLALQRDYAVVLLDVQMPDMDGFQIAELLRSRKRSAHTPIIFITAYNRADIEVMRGYSLGAVDYVFAPVVAEILRAKVAVFVELALMRQALEAEIAEGKRAAEEIERLNARLEARAAELEAANKELESFTYSVSHDLRAPLRAIDGFSHILEEEHSGGLGHEGRRVLGIVRDGAQKMSQLVEDLLAFSRHNRRPIAPVDIDMRELAEAVFRELLQNGAACAPELRLPRLPTAQGEPALIRQVWINLLSNAIKYSSKRPEPVVEVSGHADGAERIYCVKDNGAGFDMRFRDKLFGIFQRLHGAGEFPGTGVGLAIVERVVRRHGGRVWAEGKVNEGASFYFSLPAESARVEPRARDTQHPGGSRKADGKSKIETLSTSDVRLPT
jgi:two-component system, sensor histidine kinase and response regulator